MARFQAPPHFRNVFTELADGTRQVDQGWHDWFLDLTRNLTALFDSKTIIVADAGADTTTWPLLAPDQTGVQQPVTDTALTYNASSKALGVDNLVMAKTASKGIKVDTAAPTFPWHDMLGTIDVRGTGANDPSWSVFRNGIRAYQFGLNDECWLAFHLLHDYVPNTDLFLHSHWAHASAGVVGGGVTWSFEVTYAKGHNQGAFPASVTTTITQTASTTQYQHMIAETVISVAGGSGTLLNSSLFEPDGMILVRVSLTGNTMTGTPAPFLFLCDCHYQSTGIGTKQKAPNFYL